MLADELDYVVGVDTHRDEHVLAVVAAPAGAVVAATVGARERARLPASAAVRGAHAAGAAPGRSRAPAATAPVLPATSPAAARRCSRSAARRGPSGGCAARTTRSTRPGRRGRHLPARRSRCRAAGERREALRLLLVARRSAVDVRREALGQLRGVIVTAPDRLREELRGLPVGKLLERCSRLRRSSSASADELATRLVLRSLARRIQAATVEAAELEREILGHVRALAPRLLDEPGVGPIVAAQLIVAWSHRGRAPLRSLPSPASPASRRSPPPAAKPVRHRLSRGGDRQLNRALHTVDPPPPPARPGDQGLHRTTDRRGQEPPRRHPPAQALPRPPPLPATAEPGATDDLTSHRSIIPATLAQPRPTGAQPHPDARWEDFSERQSFDPVSKLPSHRGRSAGPRLDETLDSKRRPLGTTAPASPRSARSTTATPSASAGA